MTSTIHARHQIYGAALARIHAQSYGDTFAPAWPWLAKQILAASDAPKLLDLGCGDGRWLAYAKSFNIDVQGFDSSPFFVEMATKSGLPVKLENASSPNLPDGLSAVTALGEVLAYKPAALAPAILNIGRVLPSGGLLFFDLPGPDVAESDHDRGGDGWRMSVQVRKSGKTLFRKIQIETHEGIEQELHQQLLFTPEEVIEIIEGFGLHGEILDSYGPCALLPGRFAIRGVKP